LNAVAEYRRIHPKIFWLITSLAALLITVTITCFVLFKDDHAGKILSDITSPLYDFVAMGSLVFAAKQSLKISKRHAFGWGVLAFSLFLFTLGDGLWAALELFFHSTPFPSIADGPYLLFYPFFLAGIALLPSKRVGFTEWIKRTLDLSIVMAAATLGVWIFIIGPIIGPQLKMLNLEILITIAYPLGDLILIFAVLVLIYYRSKTFNLGPVVILTCGLLMMILTDIIFSYQSLTEMYISGGILDLGWISSTLLIAFAGIYQGVSIQTDNDETFLMKDNMTAIRKILTQVVAYMPYVWVAVSFYLLQRYHNIRNIIDPNILFTGVGAIFGLVIIRQIIVFNENNRLLASLMTSIEQVNLQVDELNKANQKFQQESVKRKRIEEQLSYESLHDGLTGLANRVLFMDRLRNALEITKLESLVQYSVLYLDINNFKAINEGIGHSSGDQVLIEFSRRISNSIRTFDTAARFGGDEFILLLEYTQEENSTIELVDRILSHLQQPYYLKNKEISLTCSLGVILDISDYNNSEDIIRDMDIALYRAKEKGKSQYEVFTLEMRTSAMTRLELDGDLRNSISNGELFLVYQPIYSLEQNQIEGVEALVRWRHPLRGLVMPSEFICFAEDSGFIIEIGDWVLRDACKQLKKWHLAFPNQRNLSVNVNISGVQIKQSDFVDKVKNILNETGVNPHSLILEITESAFIENQLIINRLLSDLRKIGVAFAIDDFGTGYSSLGYLKNLSVDSIKIDKSFIDDIVDDKKGYEIVKTIIQMAQELGIKTVAEGIETSQQLLNLQSLACTFGQGYLLSKPVNVEHIVKILQESARE
jgi:diguanylate cyclase (GGDEF)-like protein